MFSPTRARTRRATWLQAAIGFALAAAILTFDLIYGWRWWHVGLAVVMVATAVPFARGALNWHEPQRAREEDPDRQR